MSKSIHQIIIFKIISFLEYFVFFPAVSLQGTTLNDFSEWILTFFSNFKFLTQSEDFASAMAFA